MERSNSRIKSTNFGLIFIIILITSAISLGIYLFAQSKLGIRGYSWIFASMFWLMANFFITYFDSLYKEQGSVAAFVKAAWEYLLLFAASTIILYFLNYAMLPGILIFAVFTFVKMVMAYNPYTHVLEKMVYADRSEIEALQRTGIWISDEILELESLDQLPKPKPKKESRPKFLEAAALPASAINAQPKSLKLDKSLSTGLKEKAEVKTEPEKEPARSLKPVMEEAMALLSEGKNKITPQKLEDVLSLAKRQLLLSKDEKFVIPKHLTQKGIDEIHGDIPAREQHHMDDKERIEILFVSVLKDMSDLFNIKLSKVVDTQITFPWELSSGRRMKLTERIKVGDQDIISITGALSEDFTYALIAANLADIWFEENAQPGVGEYKSGFHFWLAYKLLKNRDFIDAAVQASKQNPAQFGKIRDIEKESGEYGVLSYLTSTKSPETQTKEDATETTPAPVQETIIEKALEPQAALSLEPRKPKDILVHPSRKNGDKNKDSQTKQVPAAISLFKPANAESKPVDKKDEKKAEAKPLNEELQKKKGPVEISRDAATGSALHTGSAQTNGLKPPPAEIKRADVFEDKAKKEEKKVLGVPVSIMVETKKEIKEKVRMDPVTEAVSISKPEDTEEDNSPVTVRFAENEEKITSSECDPVAEKIVNEINPEKLVTNSPVPEHKEVEQRSVFVKEPDSVKQSKSLVLDFSKKDEKTQETKQEKTSPLFRKAEVKLGKEESKKMIPLDLDMTRMLRLDKQELPQILKAGKIISLRTGEIEDIKNNDKPGDGENNPDNK